MTAVYQLTYWRNAREKTVFQESQQEGWYYEGDYMKPSEVRLAIARLRTYGFEKFQVVEVTAKLISIDHLDILSDP
jgi:hypothetical protein